MPTQIQKLLQRVYRLLSIRPRSEKEIRDYLARKKAQKPDEIIEKLKEQDLVNDERFAREWVEARRKKKGKIAIKLELLQKGISKEIIGEAISLQQSAISEENIAQKLLDKKINLWKNLSSMEFRRKATGFLMRRGFEYEVVKQVVEKFLQKD